MQRGVPHASDPGRLLARGHLRPYLSRSTQRLRGDTPALSPDVEPRARGVFQVCAVHLVSEPHFTGFGKVGRGSSREARISAGTHFARASLVSLGRETDHAPVILEPPDLPSLLVGPFVLVEVLSKAVRHVRDVS